MDMVTRDSHAYVTARLREVASLAPLVRAAERRRRSAISHCRTWRYTIGSAIRSSRGERAAWPWRYVASAQ